MSVDLFSCKKNVLILSCLGGNGHEAARKALEERLSRDYQFEVVYPFKSLKVSQFLDAEKLYNNLLKYGQNRLINCLTKLTPLYFISDSEDGVSQEIERAIQKFKPALVISLAPMFNQFSISVCNQHKIPYCMITLDTDLTKWSIGLEKVARTSDQIIYTVGHDLPETRGLLQKKGIDSAKIRTIGFPIREEFEKMKPSREVLCEELCLPKDLPIILVMLGKTYSYHLIRTLVSQKFHAHFVVIAGKNESLRQSIKKLAVKKTISLTTVGFTSRVSDYMRVSHLLITKPGPGTVNEVAALYRKYNAPFLLLDKKDCLFWEKPNIRLAEEGGFGESFIKEEELIDKVGQYLAQENPVADLNKIPENNFQDRIEEIIHELLLSSPPEQVMN